MQPPSLVLAACLLTAACPPVSAQYKWIAPGGGVTYSDLPPPPGVASQPVSITGRASASSDAPELPAGLRSPAERHPVVLYTTRDCGPCQQGRSHLTRRGIPFAEKTVLTEDDVNAFKRLGFPQTGFPALSIGRQKSTGFEAEAWDKLLDAAGYPKSATLPPGYRLAPAQSLAGPARRASTISDDASGSASADGNAAVEVSPSRSEFLQTGRRPGSVAGPSLPLPAASVSPAPAASGSPPAPVFTTSASPIAAPPSIPAPAPASDAPTLRF